MYACVMAVSTENESSSESKSTSTPRRQDNVSQKQSPSPEETPTPTSALPIQDCEKLGPRIIDLSEKNENPFAGRILKLYEIAEVSRTETRLDCQATAKWSKGGDNAIRYHVEVDADGDAFIGYERGDAIEPTATPGSPLTLTPTPGSPLTLTPTPGPSQTPTPTPGPSPTPTPTLEEAVYPPGMYRVGVDIQPGLYEGHDRCYWYRLKGASGEYRDIIALGLNPRGGGRFFVEILPNDKFFKLEACSVRLVSGNE